MRRILTLVAALAAVAAFPSAADARYSRQKAIWGPVSAHAFKIYRNLGAGIYEMQMHWANVATSKPRRPRDPRDPAYQWPKRVEQAVKLARRSRVRVLLEVSGAPAWANGGHKADRWAPKRPRDYAKFVYAASRRYPSVHLWMIWGEPSRANNFMPFHPEHRRASHRAPAHMGPRQKVAPHLYARILDAAYGSLKAASQRNVVIGGNTFTTGDISPYNWIRNLRLPDGRPPRMDMYGHNPFTARAPNLANPPLGYGFADFSDLRRLTGWLDRYLKGRRAGPKHLKVFLSEFFAPTDHPNHEFNFWVDRKTAASWLAAGLRIVRDSERLYALGWLALYDDPPDGHHTEVNRGLLDRRGNRKPAYYAYRRG